MISSLNFVSIKQILGGKLLLFGVNWGVLGATMLWGSAGATWGHMGGVVGWGEVRSDMISLGLGKWLYKHQPTIIACGAIASGVTFVG